MEQKTMRKILQVGGMTCTGCETRIENTLKKLDGIVDVKAIYSSSNVYVTYDLNITNLNKIIEAVEKLDYSVKNKPEDITINTAGAKVPGKNTGKTGIGQIAGIVVIIFALYMLVKNTVGFNFIPQVDQSMGYGILFFIGLLTSLHCVAMCGGINLSVCVQYKASGGDSKYAKLKPSLLYNAGRVISYTLVGGIVGGLGSVISFSGTAKGIVAILSGVFMVIMGLNMLNIFPALRKLNPRMPKIFAKKVHENSGSRGPLVVGLLNGLMPCGPLQAMQIYALGTGSIMAGALSMFLFSLGTVPLMFGFGAVSSFLSGKFTHRMMKVSAALVLILGIVMLNRGLALSGFNTNIVFGATPATGGIAKLEGDVQIVNTQLESGRYAPIIVQKGIPVKWTISAAQSELNGCNNSINIPEYGIENKKLAAGENVIEFTPDKEGTFVYTCWMGMITSNIKVVSDISGADASDVAAGDNSLGALGGGGCCAAGSKATKFAGGKIPTDDIQLAKITDNRQEVTVTVNDYGYSPAVVILQKGVPAKIKFNTEQLNSCNNVVVFPEYQGQLDLQNQKETPLLTPEQDFTFQCWMGMLHGYVKVVDDINNVDMEEVKGEVENYTPPAGAGGCCG
ncbi:sulfite exporter TauE/SafE family protein [Ruminiclostridium cellobioparum]|uniref:urease accessory protein UreH domain-containing protein n=1 Tax=Ruminiclostridium cellobioparum TaxID=29355 RepID=UPI00047F6F78|nr:sulfite exporter TauE/SafE family protein [Ruminiclostridium cellobioparum]